MSKHSSILDVADILNSYTQEMKDKITESAINIANEGKNTLKNTSPKKTGSYSKGWRVSTKKGSTFVNATIYNATDYQLTHLLENGHLARDGSKVPAKVHIQPVHDDCCNRFSKEVEEIVRG